MIGRVITIAHTSAAATSREFCTGGSLLRTDQPPVPSVSQAHSSSEGLVTLSPAAQGIARRSRMSQHVRWPCARPRRSFGMRTFLLHAAAAASSHHRSTTASSSFDDALLRHLDPECISRGIARAAGVLPLREPAARQKSYARTFRLDAAYRGGRNVARGRHLAEIPSGFWHSLRPPFEGHRAKARGDSGPGRGRSRGR